MADITNPIFHDEAKAIAHLEASRWPDQVNCPHCWSLNVRRMAGTTQAGMFLCNDCRDKFTASTGTVMERSHIPVHKWLLAMHLMAASKKGISAKQIERMLAISYKSAWFLCHRIREAMRGTTPSGSGPIGGENKVVESDETYVGGKARNAHKSKPIPKKHAVVTLVERDGEVRARHVPDVTAKTIREHIVTQASRKSHLMSDESNVYVGVGQEFTGHSAVNHSADEYVRLGGFAHVNTAEAFHSLIKRAVFGSWHAISEQHLNRYVDECAFRWNHRIALGVDDTARAAAILKGAEGKRLTYRRSDEA